MQSVDFFLKNLRLIWTLYKFWLLAILNNIQTLHNIDRKPNAIISAYTTVSIVLSTKNTMKITVLYNIQVFDCNFIGNFSRQFGQILPPHLYTRRYPSFLKSSLRRDDDVNDWCINNWRCSCWKISSRWRYIVIWVFGIPLLN